MMISDRVVRHNTMEIDDLVQENTKGALDSIPERLKPTGERSLRDGGPGVRNDGASGSWLKAGSLKLAGTNGHYYRNLAVDEMNKIDGYYRLNAYTNMGWKDPHKRALNDGNMCSGTIAYANMRIGTLPSNFRYSYTASGHRGLDAGFLALREEECRHLTGGRELHGVQ